MSVTAVPLPPVERRVVGGLWLGLALLALIGIAAALYSTARIDLPPKAFLARNARQPGVVVMPSGLQYQVLHAGTGVRPTASDIALINYEGRFANGTVFDRGGPVPMPVGRTFPGFAEGLTLMPVGSRFRLWIPPALGAGLPRRGGWRSDPAQFNADLRRRSAGGRAAERDGASRRATGGGAAGERNARSLAASG